jgi:DnaK suppressor protein
MRHLDTNDRRALHLQLDMLKRQVLDELRASAPAAQRISAESQHEVKTHADEAEAERADDVRFAEIEIDRARLEEIDQALARIAGGRYGICEDCGADIPRARLFAQPTAIRCAACQAALEARRRH